MIDIKLDTSGLTKLANESTSTSSQPSAER
jgi:hypothetical protein